MLKDLPCLSPHFSKGPVSPAHDIGTCTTVCVQDHVGREGQDKGEGPRNLALAQLKKGLGERPQGERPQEPKVSRKRNPADSAESDLWALSPTFIPTSVILRILAEDIPSSRTPLASCPSTCIPAAGFSSSRTTPSGDANEGRWGRQIRPSWSPAP